MLQCPVCGGAADSSKSGDFQDVDCLRCGKFRITTSARAILGFKKSDDKLAFAKASHFIATHQGVGKNWLIVDTDTLDEVVSFRLPRPPTQRLNLLRELARRSAEDPQEFVEVIAADWAGIVGTKDGDGVDDILVDAEQAGLIEFIPDDHYRLTHAGAEAVDDVSAPTVNIAPAPTALVPYVDLARLDQLRALDCKDWDARRLVRMCEELNSAWEGGSFISVAMLVRSAIDHVPPVFGATTFAQVAAGAGRSTKASLQTLENSLRTIADRVLHEHMRKREVLPTATQVDVRREFDVLLGEVAARMS